MTGSSATLVGAWASLETRPTPPGVARPGWHAGRLRCPGPDDQVEWGGRLWAPSSSPSLPPGLEVWSILPQGRVGCGPGLSGTLSHKDEPHSSFPSTAAVCELINGQNPTLSTVQ